MGNDDATGVALLSVVLRRFVVIWAVSSASLTGPVEDDGLADVALAVPPTWLVGVNTTADEHAVLDFDDLSRISLRSQVMISSAEPRSESAAI